MNNITDKKKISALASLSFVFSTVGFFVPFAGSLTGVVLGEIAMRGLNRDTKIQGYGLAKMGVNLGYSGLITWSAIAFLMVHFRGLH